MTDSPAQLEMRWLPVVDASGRTRMEAVWFAPGNPAAVAPAHAA